MILQDFYQKNFFSKLLDNTRIVVYIKSIENTQEVKTVFDKLVVKFASSNCINADGSYVTVDGNRIDVSNKFETLFTQIRYGKKPGSVTYMGCSRSHNYYEVEMSKQDWEKLLGETK